MDLLEKINTLPHPWYGTVELRLFKRSTMSKINKLTLDEKQKLWPSPSWADDRDVYMNRAQLQQALAGNFMMPGEEALRISLLNGVDYG